VGSGEISRTACVAHANVRRNDSRCSACCVGGGRNPLQAGKEVSLVSTVFVGPCLLNKKKSYAAVASPDGQSFNALSSSSSISPPLKSESRAPSFADKVKSGGKMESSSPTNSDNSELEFKAKGKRGAKFVVLTGGGGRTIN
jgi:hypothetical protein